MPVSNNFDRLLEEGETASFSGWNFSYLQGRWQSDPLPWDYMQFVRQAFTETDALLDIDTGGGERLASLTPLPAVTYATETYPPNIPIAQARLEPLGVMVVDTSECHGGMMPLPDAQFPLVINRHGAVNVREIARVLRSGGVFITQQVGSSTNQEFRQWIVGDTSKNELAWSLHILLSALMDAGFVIRMADEHFGATTFFDIGAVVYYLRAVPWTVPDFTVAAYRSQLWDMDQHIVQHGGLTVTSHHFVIIAEKQ